MKRRLYIGLLVLVGMLLAGIASYQEWFYYLDHRTTDALYQQHGTPDPKIKIIAIDEKSLESLGAFGTWDRSVYAELVNKLSAGDNDPAVIGFDEIFGEDMEEAGDLDFAEACGRAGNVVAAIDLVNKARVEIDEKTGESYLNPLYVESVIEPYAALSEQVECGFVEATIERDGYIRQAFWEMFADGEEIPSFSRVVYERYAKEQGIPVVEPQVDRYGRFGFVFTGEPGDYDRYSFVDVLNGDVDMRLFKDSIVLIGAYAPGLRDSYHVAGIGEDRQMYGVEIQANIIQAYQEENTKETAAPQIVALVCALIVGAYICAMFLLNVKTVIGIGISVCVLYTSVGVLLYREGLYIPLITVVLFVTALCVGEIVVSYVLESMRRAKLTNAFKRYVGPKVADHLIRNGDYQVEQSGELRDVAVLFVDIRSFTSLSESLEPQQIVEVLNLYLDMATHFIFRENGMLDKFIGDAAMAVFNSPFDLDDYEYRAVKAALSIVHCGKDLADYTQEHFGRRVEFGIGIHCGPAVVGSIGSEIRLDYTAIGDTVNTASRIEGKAGSGQILISEEMKERLEGRIVVREVGAASLKGKKQEKVLYEVVEALE